MAKNIVEQFRHDLDLLSRSLLNISQGLDRFVQRYQSAQNITASSLERLKELSAQYQKLATEIKKVEGLKGFQEQQKAIIQLQNALKEINYGEKFKIRPEHYSSIRVAFSQIEQLFSRINQLSFKNQDLGEFFSRKIFSRFSPEVIQNFQKFLKRIYGDLDREISEIKPSRFVTLQTLAKERGIALPPGFRAEKIKYLKLHLEPGIESSVPYEKFRKDLEVIIDTITGEVKTLDSYLRDLNKLSAHLKSTSQRQKKKVQFKPEEVYRDLETKIRKLKDIPDSVKSLLIKEIENEFRDVDQLIKISLSKTAAGTRIRASTGQKTVTFSLEKLLSRIGSGEKQKTEAVLRPLKEQLEERINVISQLSEENRKLLTSLIYESLKGNIDLIQKFEVDLNRGLIKLRGKKAPEGAVFSARFAIPDFEADAEKDDIILRKRLETLAEQELLKLRERFNENAVQQIQSLAKSYISELSPFEYIGYDVGAPRIEKRFGEVYPIRFYKKQLDIEEPLFTAQTAISFQEGKIVDVLAIKKAEAEEQRRIDELKRKLQSVPGLFEIVNTELRKVGLTLRDISAIDFIDLGDDLVEVRLLNRELTNISNLRKIVGRITPEGFIEDPRIKIQQYLLRQRLAENEASATAQTEKVLRTLQQHGFNLAATRINISHQLPAGITYFTAVSGDPSEGIRKLTVALNKYNEVITFSNRRTLEFFDAIRQNTIDIFKWSIGATLVYGSYWKLNEAIQIAIENEAKLAQIGVVLGASQENLNEIFRSAADIAERTGESLTGVLEAYSFAYRAVGGISDPLEKSAASAELLTNALILSKLSSLSTAESIDILSGALRQMQKPGETVAEAFKKGRDLLDAWVVTSRKANVDLATLATAFSVVEEQAANVGMTMEQINAMIAALSEKVGGYGGKETGNAIRAIIGGMYTTQAAEALNRFGIATRTTTGELRNFLDISFDIYRLYEAGLISEPQLSKLAYAIGGGVRNQQRVQLFLTDLPKVIELTQVQMDRAGASQEALAQTMVTVETRVRKLSNAFFEFAQVFGTRTGLLDGIKALLTMLTALVEVLTKATDLFGELTIPLAVGGALQAYSILARDTTRFTSFVKRIDEMFMSSPLLTLMGGDIERSKALSKVLGRGTFGAGVAIVGSLGYIGEALEQDKTKWWAVGGAIAGGIVGSLVGGPVGAILGQAIGGAFVNTVVSSKSELAEVFIPREIPKPEVLPETPKLPTSSELLRQEALKAIEKGLYGVLNLEFWGLKLGSLFSPTFEFQGKEYKFPTDKEQQNLVGLAIVQAMNVIKRYEESTFGRGRPTKEQYEAAKALLEAAQKLEKSIPRESTPEELENTFVTRYVRGFSEQNRVFIERFYREQQSRIKADFFRDVYNLSDYRRLSQNLLGLPSVMASYSTIKALGQANIGDINDELLKLLPNAEEFARIFVEAPSESSQQITEQITLILDLAKAIEVAEGGVVSFRNEQLSTNSALELLNTNVEILNELFQQTQQQVNRIRFDKLKSLIPQGVELREIVTEEDYQAVYRRALELQKAFFTAVIKAGVLTREDYEFMFRNAPDIMVELGKNLGVKIAEGIIDSRFLTEAFKESLRLGEINVGLDYQFLDVTKAQFDAIEAQYQAIRQAILAAGGVSEETPLLTFFKDSNNPYRYDKDWKIVQHLLSQILDTERKQLDGIYNLPSEATAWVPFQSLQYAYQKGLNEAKIETPNFAPINNAAQKTGKTLDDLAFFAGKAATSFRYILELPLTSQSTQPLTTKARKTSAEMWQDLYEYYKRQTPSNLTPEQRVVPDTALGQTERRGGALSEGIKRGVEGFFNEVITKFKEFFSGLKGLTLPSQENINPNWRVNPKNPGGIPQIQLPQLSTNLKLNLNTTTQLVVDGKILATIVKNYLWEDLVRYANSASVSTHSYTLI